MVYLLPDKKCTSACLSAFWACTCDRLPEVRLDDFLSNKFVLVAEDKVEVNRCLVMHLLRFRKTHFLLKQLVNSNRGNVINDAEEGCVANFGQYFVAAVQ